MKKIYISGQITGLTREEYTARFCEAEQLLHAAGYKVVNPVKFCVCKYGWLYRLLGYRLTLLYDLWRLMQCDAIYKIPGWRESKGASIESCVAFHFNLNLVPSVARKKIDMKMAKFIERRESHDGQGD